MNSTDQIALRGDFFLSVYDAQGNLKNKVEKRNLIVNTGYSFLLSAAFQDAGRPDHMGYLALGTGAVAPDVTDTALGAEVTRQGATYDPANYPTTNYATLTGSFTSLTDTITEAGLFNIATADSGTMLNRVTFTGIPLQTTDTLVVKFQISIGPAS